MRINVWGEAAGGAVGEHSLLARRRGQTGDEGSQEPGVPVGRPRVERDHAGGNGVLYGGLEPLERDSVDDLIADLVQPTIGQRFAHERKAVRLPGNDLDRVLASSGAIGLGGLPDPRVGSVDQAVGEARPGEIAVEQYEGELDEAVVVVLDGGHSRDPVAECRRQGVQRNRVGVGMESADCAMPPTNSSGAGTLVDLSPASATSTAPLRRSVPIPPTRG